MQSQVKQVKKETQKCNCIPCQFDGLQGREVLVYRGREYCTKNQQYKDLKKFLTL